MLLIVVHSLNVTNIHCVLFFADHKTNMNDESTHTSVHWYRLDLFMGHIHPIYSKKMIQLNLLVC
jgi:hypothetical protein